MAKITRLSSEQRDNLAAYLDGELDEHGTQEIEQVLAVSEVARHEVDMLSRTWDLLNELPTYKAADDFTHKTITSLRAAEQAGPGAAAVELVYRNARRGVVPTAWIGVLSACAYVGFMATNHWVPNESEQLLQDYDVINNLDQYSEVVNRQPGGSPVEFLEIIKSRRTLSEHDEPSEK